MCCQNVSVPMFFCDFNAGGAWKLDKHLSDVHNHIFKCPKCEFETKLRMELKNHNIDDSN